MEADKYYENLRFQMVREQIEWRGIHSQRLLIAMRSVARHLFVPEDDRERAYYDGPLAIGEGQTISQPYIVAVMTDLLELSGTEKVLEIGTGSGYQAAILGLLAAEVHSVERSVRLGDSARLLLQKLGHDNVHVHISDGSMGLEEYAPYQGILVTAAAPTIPPNLLEQLAPGGRLVIPVGGKDGQDLQRWRKIDQRIEQESIFPVAFVPLRGQAGWSEEDWTRRADYY